MTRLRLGWSAMAVLIGALGMTACGGGGSDTPSGTLRVALTDGPACGFDAVNVTVTAVRVHASQTADENAQGWHDLTLVAPRRIDLLSLQNGILEELGQRVLPAGQYTQLRLMLQPNRGVNVANSVMPTGGGEQALDTPSAVQSGIKLIRPFTVPAGGLADLVLDFDACKSIVDRGNGTYGLKPVVSVTPRAVAEIVGFVDVAVAGVRVSAQSNGTVLRASAPDATGAFRLAYLDPAATPQVTVVLTAPGRTSTVIGGVPIVLQGTTRVSTSLVPITLPLSNTRIASGVAQPAAAVPTVRALQAVNVVPKVEIASTNVDLAGSYVLTLPVAPPRFAPFGALPLAFSAPAPGQVLYTIEASADGFVTQSQGADLTTSDATANFMLDPTP